ncbi:hypothetical protein T484DRAFT_1771654 [Baffinella frigidus]|nr:hypothetical protein T484DRAFT_1771654 [Cryptophyta sp. CCMP2293]
MSGGESGDEGGGEAGREAGGGRAQVPKKPRGFIANPYRKLQEAIADLVDDYQLVHFIPLNIHSPCEYPAPPA